MGRLAGLNHTWGFSHACTDLLSRMTVRLSRRLQAKGSFRGAHFSFDFGHPSRRTKRNASELLVVDLDGIPCLNDLPFRHA